MACSLALIFPRVPDVGKSTGSPGCIEQNRSQRVYCNRAVTEKLVGCSWREENMVVPTGFELESTKSADDTEGPEVVDISTLKIKEG